jgi:Flp pilus assembly protein TadD
VPERFFRALDGTIGAFRAAAEANGALLMIASDHGFIWGEGRPSKLSSVATASAAKWHAQDGIYLLWGPGIPAKIGHESQGGIQQVCATLLALAGLPPGRDVDGDPLDGAPLVKAARVDYVSHYKPAVLEAASTSGTAADRETIANLRALGYIGQAESTSAPSGSRGTTRTPGSYNNEGLVWRSRGKLPQAMESFEKALTLDPNLVSAAWNLSDVLYARGVDLDRSDDLLLRAFAGGLPDGARFLIGRAIAYQRGGDSARSLKLMSAAVSAKPQDHELWLFKGRYEVEANDCVAAIRDFDRAIALSPTDPTAYSSSALAHLCTGDRAGARRAFERSLQLDPAQPKVREYLEGMK